MDREISQEQLRKTLTKQIIKYSSVVLIIIVLFFIMKSALSPSINQARMRTSIAEIGNIYSSVSATGTIVPEYEQNITSPIQTKILNINYLPGQSVKMGEKIIQLDLENIQNELNKLEDDYNLLKVRLKKESRNFELQLSDLISQKEIKKLRIDFLISTRDREKKLYEIGAGKRVSLEQAELDLKIAEREYEFLKQKISQNELTLESEIKELELELSIKEKTLAIMNKKMKDAEVIATNNGVVTWVKNEIGANINSGDLIAKVANLSSYKVEAKVSDIYANKLFIYNEVIIRINNNDLKGKINNISPSITEGEILFTVELTVPNHKILKPNIRAEIFVITSSRTNIVRIKNGPFFNQSLDQNIYVVKNNKAIKTNAEFGISNIDWVEIKSGIKAGDRVIISDMEEYYHLDEIDFN